MNLAKASEVAITWSAQRPLRSDLAEDDTVDRRPGRRSTGLIILGGVLAAIVLILLADRAGIPEAGPRAGLACWTTVPYIVAGAVARLRRPDSRLGMWMVLAGYVTFLNFLIWSSNPFVYTLATAVQFGPPLMFLMVFLTYPTGYVEFRADRAVIGLAMASAALSLVHLPLGSDETVLTVGAGSPATAEFLQDAQLVTMTIALSAGALLLMVRRIRRPLRAWFGYLVSSFSVVLVMLAVLYLVQVTGWGLMTEPVRLTTFGLVGMTPIVFLLGMLQDRLSRASAAELLAISEGSPGPAELQAGIVRALRDPSARVLYWIPEFDTYADVDGKASAPDPEPGMSSTPVTRDGAPVAMLLHHHTLDLEPTLLASVASAAGLLIEKAQLEVELRARVEELRGSRIRILEAEQRERRRLERNLHDGAQQRLLALSLALGEIETRLGDDQALRSRVTAARSEAAEILAELRDLARGIHPAALIDHGLMVALESLATRAQIPVGLEGDSLDGMPRSSEVTAFYLVSEALANIAKHSRASSAVIETRIRGDNMQLIISDDGVGGADTRRGTGLRGLADRVEAVGGTFKVWSPPDGGTRIEAVIPCE